MQEDVPYIAIGQKAEEMTAILKESGTKFTNETWSRLAKVCGWEGVKSPVGATLAIGTETTKDIVQVTKPYWNEHYGKRNMTINDIYAGALKPAAVDAAQDLKTSASTFTSLFQRKQQD